MEKVPILFLIFKRKEQALRAFEPIKRYRPERLYIAADGPRGSVDGEKDECESTRKAILDSIDWDCKLMTLFRNKNLGCTDAAKLDYDYYLWLNDDTMAYPYMLNELLSASNSKNDEAIIIGPTQDTKHQKTTYGGFLHKGGFVPVDGRLNQIRYFNGNIVLIPRKVFLKLGNLDYHYLHSKGDFDYGLRACEQGICSYQVGRYLGECEEHPDLDKWCIPKFAFRDRWRAMMRPNGMPPGEVFYFAKKHTGILTAPLHAFSVILRCCFPWLWT